MDFQTYKAAHKISADDPTSVLRKCAADHGYGFAGFYRFPLEAGTCALKFVRPRIGPRGRLLVPIEDELLSNEYLTEYVACRIAALSEYMDKHLS